MNVKACIEALLFATDQPLTLARIHEVLPDVPRDEVAQALAALEAEQETAERALRVQRVAGGLQLVTKPEYADVVRRLFVGKRRVRLTKPALEALAIIAYKQPTTRPEIDAIRGVSSGGVVETLFERNLVRIAGRADSVGRPLLYATSSEFLQYLGLDSLRDLPSLEELEAMLAAREDEARRQEEDELRELSQAAPPADDTAHAAEDRGDSPGARFAVARGPRRRAAPACRCHRCSDGACEGGASHHHNAPAWRGTRRRRGSDDGVGGWLKPAHAFEPLSGGVRSGQSARL